jgi:NAD(P)-dependent dehydrogenase (short-subunit alcohol dehydrogenase family)
VVSIPTPHNVLVQGASRGIGLALVRALLADTGTDRIIATCRRPGRAGELGDLAVADHRLTIVALDAADESSIADAAGQVAGLVDRLDVVINVAGLLHDAQQQPEKRLADVGQRTLVRSFAVNAIAPILVARYFEGLLMRSSQPIFATLSARLGSISDNRLGGWYAYRASKAAQNMLLRTLSIEWKRHPRPIVCLAIHPGTVDTGLSRPFRRRDDTGRVFPAERAARQILAIVAAATPADNGRFVDWRGATIGW